MNSLAPHYYYQENLKQAEAEILPFFVYGTLRPPDFNYQSWFKGRTAQERNDYYLSQAVIYSLGRFPALIEKPGEDVKVWGHLIDIPNDIYTRVKSEIDQLEWYTHGLVGNWYWRVVREVVSPEGEKVRAWVYIATMEWLATVDVTPKLIPDGDWLKFKGF